MSHRFGDMMTLIDEEGDLADQIVITVDLVWPEATTDLQWLAAPAVRTQACAWQRTASTWLRWCTALLTCA